jgi:peptidoglycan/xylan/chitin deacetylase (PgdA/CDA1 family)
MKYINRNSILKLFKLFNGYPVNTFLSGDGVILAFHRVTDKKLSIYNHGLEISACKFQAMLNYLLKHNYEFISLDNALERKFSRSCKKFAVITFDDGYKDNFTVAYPILKKYKIPFTVYVTTKFPDRTAILWWYLLEEIIIKKVEIKFTYLDVDYSFNCATEQKKEMTFNAIRKFIIDTQPNAIKEKLTAIFRYYFDSLYQGIKDLTLSWKDISILAQDPLVSIENHTVNHFSLAHLQAQDVRCEIEEAKTLILKKTGSITKHLAYPFGSRNEVNQATAEAVSELGYSTAVTTMPGNIFKECFNNRLLLPRYTICEKTSKYELNMMLNGIYAFLRNGYKNPITL